MTTHPETNQRRLGQRDGNGARGAVFELEPRSLTEANPGYRDIAEVTRLFADGAPIHIAMHWIDDAQPCSTRDYSCSHIHDDLTEVNILLGEPGGLAYNVVLAEGEEPTYLEAPCVVIIPPGVSHSANVVSGRGWFVVLRLASEQGL